MGSERRRHRRYRLWIPARIEAGGSRLAIGHDMSRSGSMMVTRRKLKVGEEIELYVRIPPDADEERAIRATIIRCDVNDEDPEGLWPYRIAVAFDEESPELEELLRHHSAMLEGLADAGEQAG